MRPCPMSRLSLRGFDMAEKHQHWAVAIAALQAAVAQLEQRLADSRAGVADHLPASPEPTPPVPAPAPHPAD